MPGLVYYALYHDSNLFFCVLQRHDNFIPQGVEQLPPRSSSSRFSNHPCVILHHHILSRCPLLFCSPPGKQALRCHTKSHPISLSSDSHFISPQSISRISFYSLAVIGLKAPLSSLPSPAPTAEEPGRILWKSQKTQVI